jgi:hypothetical protein
MGERTARCMRVDRVDDTILQAGDCDVLRRGEWILENT